jgi:thioredoxin-related protein
VVLEYLVSLQHPREYQVATVSEVLVELYEQDGEHLMAAIHRLTDEQKHRALLYLSGYIGPERFQAVLDHVTGEVINAGEPF